jgi:hypothetical protein
VKKEEFGNTLKEFPRPADKYSGISEDRSKHVGKYPPDGS